MTDKKIIGYFIKTENNIFGNWAYNQHGYAYMCKIQKTMKDGYMETFQELSMNDGVLSGKRYDKLLEKGTFRGKKIYTNWADVYDDWKIY